jgi:hypothetical protein
MMSRMTFLGEMGCSWKILGKDFSDKEKTDVVINFDFTVQKGVGSLLSTMRRMDSVAAGLVMRIITFENKLRFIHRGPQLEAGHHMDLIN